MRRVIWTVLALCLFSGCGGEPVYETIGNVWENVQPVQSPGVIEFALTEDAQMEVLGTNQDAVVYQIGQWTLWTQVLEGGDVENTLKILTGLEQEKIQVIAHPQGKYNCYETVWAATEEEGETVIRTAVIPYGGYHYCISLKAPAASAKQAGQISSGLLDNVYLNDTST